MALSVYCVTEHWEPKIGGMEHSIRNLCSRLPPDIRPHVLTCSPADTADHPAAVTDRHPTDRRLTDRRPTIRRWSGMGAADFYRVALDYLADTPAPRIVHMFGFSFAAVQAQGEFLRVGAGLPQTQIVFKVPTTGDARRYLPALPEEGVSAVAAFVALNRDIVQELSEQRVLTERIVQLPNGVCIDQFCPVSAARRRELQEHWQLPTDRPVVGFCGRFETRKQIDVLLAGLQALDRDTRPCLLLVGRPDHTFGAGVDVRKWLSADVRWIGEQRDMPLVFGALDAYVTASRAEGMSNALLEALACGLPIIASDIPGHRELVTEGENGWLFPVGDAPALAQRLAWLRHAWRSGAWEAYSAASRERAVRQYDQVALSQTYADLYRRLAARSTP